VKKASKSKSKYCGDFSREELLEKRLSELRKLLKLKGIDGSDLEDTEQAADVYCQFNKFEESCSEENGYKCGDDRICNVSVKPGVCEDPLIGNKEASKIEYKGRTIVGNKEAIKALRKKLGLKSVSKSKKEEVDPFSPKGFERNRLIKRAMHVSGMSKDDFEDMSNEDIENFIQNYDIKEKKSKAKLIKQLAAKEKKKQEEELSAEELRERASLIGPKALKAKDREEMIEALSSWLDRNPSYFKDWSNKELRQRLEALREWQQEAGEQNRLNLIEELASLTGRHKSFYNDWSIKELRQRLQALKESMESSDEEERLELIKQVSALTGRHKSFYNDWTVEELQQRLEAEEGEEDEEEEENEEERLELIKQVAALTGRHRSFYNDWSVDELRQRLQAEEELSELSEEEKASTSEEEEKKDVSTSEEESEKEEKVSVSSEEEEEERAKQEKISYGDVEKVLSDVVAGKGGKIEELSKVQKAVFKCLGLINA
jgi:hypothetical protein